MLHLTSIGWGTGWSQADGVWHQKEYPIPKGAVKGIGKADLVLFDKPATAGGPGEPLLVIEVKADANKAQKNALGQLDRYASGLLYHTAKPLHRVLGASVVGNDLTIQLFRYSTDHFPGADAVEWSGKAVWRLVVTANTCVRQPLLPKVMRRRQQERRRARKAGVLCPHPSPGSFLPPWLCSLVVS